MYLSGTIRPPLGTEKAAGGNAPENGPVGSGAPEGGVPGVRAAGGGVPNPAAMRFIILKFAGWFVFIFVVALFLRRGTWGRREKMIGYGVSLLAFGVFFGPEPSPMHPVKDFVFRLGAMGKPVPIFLAFIAVLLVASVALNRSICAWGCQFGVFQDFIHRIFRNKKDTKSVVASYTPPFWLSNTVRAVSFFGMIFAAFVLSFDLFGNIDPFKLFSPGKIGIAAGIFAGVVILGSIFIYRPFCYFFCPFGLLSWLASKLSIIRIRIDRDACTDCSVCVRACPSNAMKGIYEKKALPPDCYTCGSCLSACPTRAISLSGPSKKG
jgi:polyferredoxin